MSFGDVGQPFTPRPAAPPLWLRLAFCLIAAGFIASPVLVYFYPELFA